VVTAVDAYQMRAATPEELLPATRALSAGEIDLVPLLSPRTAAILLDALGPGAREVLGRTLVGAIGPTTAAALREAGVRVDEEAAAPNIAVLLRALAAKR
jgi:uroporphyrinogen-III synthase